MCLVLLSCPPYTKSMWPLTICEYFSPSPHRALTFASTINTPYKLKLGTPRCVSFPLVPLAFFPFNWQCTFRVSSFSAITHAVLPDISPPLTCVSFPNTSFRNMSTLTTLTPIGSMDCGLWEDLSFAFPRRPLRLASPPVQALWPTSSRQPEKVLDTETVRRRLSYVISSVSPDSCSVIVGALVFLFAKTLFISYPCSFVASTSKV